MSFDFRRVAVLAALLGAATGSMGGVGVSPARRSSAPGAFGSGRKRKRAHNPAGSKLWRKHHRVGDEVGRMHSNVRGY